MAFRRGSRRFSRRRSFRRRPLARVRRTWHTGFQANICNLLELGLSGCGDQGNQDNRVHLILLSNADLESKWSDRATVKRIVGDLFWQPAVDNSPDPGVQTFNTYASGVYEYHWGLYKQRISQVQPNGSLDLHPLTNSVDYSEGEWLKTWHGSPNPDFEFTFSDIPTHDANFIVNCGLDIHTTGFPDNDFTDGTGTINIETSCNPEDNQCHTCAQPGFNISGSQARIPKYKHQHFDVRKSIPLRENECLELQWTVVSPFADQLATFNPRQQLWGAIKLLLQF